MFSSAPCSQTSSFYISPLMLVTKFRTHTEPLSYGTALFKSKCTQQTRSSKNFCRNFNLVLPRIMVECLALLFILDAWSTTSFPMIQSSVSHHSPHPHPRICPREDLKLCIDHPLLNPLLIRYSVIILSFHSLS
jgi:hypothetical protein